MLLKTYNISEDLSVMLICRYNGFLYMYYIHYTYTGLLKPLFDIELDSCL